MTKVRLTSIELLNSTCDTHFDPAIWPSDVDRNLSNIILDNVCGIFVPLFSWLNNEFRTYEAVSSTSCPKAHALWWVFVAMALKFR